MPVEVRRYAYNYALIDAIDSMCIEVKTTTREIDTTEHPEYVVIPTYNEEYLFKYYNFDNQKWYEDADFTIEWIPS